MSMYLPNDDVREPGAEVDEFLDTEAERPVQEPEQEPAEPPVD